MVFHLEIKIIIQTYALNIFTTNSLDNISHHLKTYTIAIFLQFQLYDFLCWIGNS